MVRFGVALAALACMAMPALAQESTEELKKELQQLRSEVDAMKAVNQTKEIPAQGKVDKDAMAADDNPVMTLFKGTKLSGFVDVGYQFSFNQLHTAATATVVQGNHVNPVRIFDTQDNSFYMHEAHLQLERLASKDMIVGYHIELAAGHDPSVYDTGNIALQEGWVQILAPLGSGLDIRAGKMATLVGYEVLENINNMNYSRGMLFGIIQPFTHTGVRAAYGMGGEKNDMLTFTMGLNNGNNNTTTTPASDTFVDNNHGKELELQVAVRPTKDAYIGMTFLVLNDAPGLQGSTGDGAYLFDIVASYTIDKLTLAVNFDKASAQNPEPGAISGPNNLTNRVSLSGIALYAKYGWSETTATAIRYEYFSDQFGQAIGVAGEHGAGARVSEITFTQEIKVGGQLVVRIEFRHDDCNDHIFSRDGKAAKGDNTLGFEAIMPF